MVPEPDESGSSGGLVARGWTPSARTASAVYLLLALVIVAHPLVGGWPAALGISGQVTYTAYEVTPESDHFEYRSLADTDEDALRPRARLYSMGGSSLLDCYPRLAADRACLLEEGLVNQSVSVDSSRGLWLGYTYHETFYRRVAADTPDGTTLRLEPVSAATVLRNVSVPQSDWSADVTRAVRTGEITATPHVRLEGAFLSRGDSYFVVLPAESEDPPDPPGPLVSALCGVVGLLSFQRSMRTWRRHEAGE